MADAVSSVSTVGQIQASTQTDWTRANDDSTAFLSVLDQGLGTLTQRPDFASPSEQFAETLSGDYAGQVGQAKADIVGGEAARIEQSTKAPNITLEDRIKGLYFELTHYQVAWKIAQNVQRDVSQVLRGS